MTSYIAKRMLAMIPMFIGVTALLFVSINLAPGGPEMIFVAETMQLDMAEQIRHSLGLDRPFHIRYFLWLGALVRGDMGRSLTGGGIPVATLIWERTGATLLLTGISLVLSVVGALLFGTVSAFRQYSWIDKLLTIIAYMGMSFPVFWLGIMLILLFAITLDWFPVAGMTTYGKEADILSRLSHLVLPVLTMTLVAVGRLTRFVRSSMLEVLTEDYLRTARAKGIAERVVLFKHALRNGLIPIVTVVGLNLRTLLAGAVLTETIFAWPGLGRLALMSVNRRDYPVVMGVNVAVTLLVLLANLATDIAYSIVDPRIRYE